MKWSDGAVAETMTYDSAAVLFRSSYSSVGFLKLTNQ